MRRFGSRPAFLTSLLLTAALAVGCGGGGSKASSGNGLEKKTITVAALPLMDSAGLYIAQQRKFFQAEGLTVKIQPVAQSILALPALKNGQVDVISGGNYVTFLQAYDKGTLKLRILADAAAQAPRFMAALVAKNSPIKSPKDLEGKTIAVNIPNNIQSLTFNEVLKANDVDPSKVHYVQIPFPQMGAALQQHKVDVVHTGEPFGTAIQRKLGARMILDGGGAPVTDLPVSGYLSTGLRDQVPEDGRGLPAGYREGAAGGLDRPQGGRAGAADVREDRRGNGVGRQPSRLPHVGEPDAAGAADRPDAAGRHAQAQDQPRRRDLQAVEQVTKAA